MSLSTILQDNLFDIVYYLPPEDLTNWCLVSKGFQKHEESYWKQFFENKKIKIPETIVFSLKQFYYAVHLKEKYVSKYISIDQVHQNIVNYQEEDMKNELNFQENDPSKWKKISHYKMWKDLIEGDFEEYFDFIFYGDSAKVLQYVFIMKLFELISNKKLKKEEKEKIQNTTIKVLKRVN